MHDDPDAARTGYVGRFAPSPTGDLHLGSLYTAAASYLDAHAHGGRWLVRMEDVDRSREIPGAAEGILQTLEAFGFQWDGVVVRQSERSERYAAAIERLRTSGLTFECSCSRRDLADAERYPGYCRAGPRNPGKPTAIRLRVEPRTVAFIDRLQGAYEQDVAAVVGDAILKRRDGFFSYLLAVVVDDAAQGVTHVVRGADLLDDTPRQIYLQRALGLHPHRYAHVPVLTEADGSKLAKSAHALPAHRTAPHFELFRVLQLLELAPPSSLAGAGVEQLWAWARLNYSLNRLSQRRTLPVERQDGSCTSPGNPSLP